MATPLIDTPESWRRIQEILDAFDALPASERGAFLEGIDRDDPDLRRQVEALVGNDDRIDSFLETPVFPICTENLDDALFVPRIGPYKLVRELGEGGMGTVYLAVQKEPFERRVALKLIRSQLNNPDAIRRFESERQTLARIRHPNVAQLYDGGTTPDGRPYFAMEYVKGRPIHEHCDAKELTVRERLELVLQVCSAVHLAHQKLRVVHRDLKPGNILVTEDGVPKLLDFGIAKSFDADRRQEVFAPQATSVWIPQYSSPEQLAGLPLTTASDVYSLGVLLYRLLAGRLPYRVQGARPADALEEIREQVLEKPSVAVLREPDPAPSDAVRAAPATDGLSRGESPAKLHRRLAGDLDAIVLKALAENPEDRYSSVEGLARDIRGHLRGLPVVARRPTFLYRTGKFVRRHRLPLAAAATIMSLTIGLILSQAREIVQVQRVATSLVDFVAALRPASFDQKVDIEKALDEATDIVHDPMFARQPLVQALLMDTLGTAYTSLGRYEEAERWLTGALEIRRRDLRSDHPLLAESFHNLAYLFEIVGDVKAAQDYLDTSLQIYLQSSDPDLAELSKTINNRAMLSFDEGDYTEAEARFRQVIRMRLLLYPEDHEDVVRVRANLAATLVEQGKYVPAEDLYRQNLAVRIRLHGTEHVDVANSRNALATVLYNQGKLDDAEEEARKALRIQRGIGAEHPRVGLALVNLGKILQARGALDDAEAAYREAEDLFRTLSDHHRYVTVTNRNLASVLTARGDPETAEPLAAKALDTLRETQAPDSWRIADAESVHAGCLAAMGRFAEAEEPLLRSFEVIREARGEWAPYTREAARRLVDLYEAWGQPDKATSYRRLAGVVEGRREGGS